MNQGENAPPLHPRCRCTIIASFGEKMSGTRISEGRRKIPAEMSYKEWRAGIEKPKGFRGLAAGKRIYFNEGGKSPYLLGNIDFKDAVAVKRVLEWAEARIVTAPVENAIIITQAGDIYHCTGGLNTLTTIEELGDKLKGAIVTHNHPVGSDNEYSFSFKDRMLFTDYKLTRLRGIDERFIYEMNRNPADLDDETAAVADETFLAHFINIKHAKSFGYGYRRWLR